jgi:hypothetical protein
LRCGCGICGTYMVHRENTEAGCVCPQCGNICRLCLGVEGQPRIVKTKDGKIAVPEEIMQRYPEKE